MGSYINMLRCVFRRMSSMLYPRLNTRRAVVQRHRMRMENRISKWAWLLHIRLLPPMALFLQQFQHQNQSATSDHLLFLMHRILHLPLRQQRMSSMLLFMNPLAPCVRFALTILKWERSSFCCHGVDTRSIENAFIHGSQSDKGAARCARRA